MDSHQTTILSLPGDVWKDIIWNFNVADACVLGRVCQSLQRHVSSFSAYWFHHFKVMKDRQYGKKFIHHGKYSRNCIERAYLNDKQKFLEYIREHLNPCDELPKFNRDRKYGFFPCMEYTYVLARSGWICGRKSHVMILDDFPNGWKEVVMDGKINPKGGWYGKYRRERFNKGKIMVKKVSKRISEDDTYRPKIFREYCDSLKKIETLKRELWYIGNIKTLENDVEECSFVTKKKVVPRTHKSSECRPFVIPSHEVMSDEESD